MSDIAMMIAIAKKFGGGSSTPAPVVILPETELFPQTQGASPYLLANPLNADMEIGKTYTATIDGTAYEVTAADGANVDPDFAGMVVVVVEDAGVLFAQLQQDQAAEAGFYGFLIVPDPSASSVTLSIVEAAKTESAGGGDVSLESLGFVTVTATGDSLDVTSVDMTFEEVMAAATAGKWMRLVKEGQCLWYTGYDTNTVYFGSISDEVCASAKYNADGLKFSAKVLS